MADKKYLDEAGIERLKVYIDTQIAHLQKAIDLLYSTDGTPGSIQQMIDDAINDITSIYGGAAPESEDEP